MIKCILQFLACMASARRMGLGRPMRNMSWPSRSFCIIHLRCFLWPVIATCEGKGHQKLGVPRSGYQEGSNGKIEKKIGHLLLLLPLLKHCAHCSWSREGRLCPSWAGTPTAPTPASTRPSPENVDKVEVATLRALSTYSRLNSFSSNNLG